MKIIEICVSKLIIFIQITSVLHQNKHKLQRGEKQNIDQYWLVTNGFKKIFPFVFRNKKTYTNISNFYEEKNSSYLMWLYRKAFYGKTVSQKVSIDEFELDKNPMVISVILYIFQKLTVDIMNNWRSDKIVSFPCWQNKYGDIQKACL